MVNRRDFVMVHKLENKMTPGCNCCSFRRINNTEQPVCVTRFQNKTLLSEHFKSYLRNVHTSQLESWMLHNKYTLFNIQELQDVFKLIEAPTNHLYCCFFFCPPVCPCFTAAIWIILPRFSSKARQHWLRWCGASWKSEHDREDVE